MAGYHGFSMSNNAVDAYNNNVMPLSRWSKQALLESVNEICIDENIEYSYFHNWTKLELMALLSYSEWHHTGADFKKTDFYAIDSDKVRQYASQKTKPTIVKMQIKKHEIEPHAYYHGSYKVTEYHPTSKYNRYNEYWYAFTNGIRKGDWIILNDGTRKKLSNCKIEKITKIRKSK